VSRHPGGRLYAFGKADSGFILARTVALLLTMVTMNAGGVMLVQDQGMSSAISMGTASEFACHGGKWLLKIRREHALLLSPM
jgi:uncharacterized protein (UPF0303 family)